MFYHHHKNENNSTHTQQKKKLPNVYSLLLVAEFTIKTNERKKQKKKINWQTFVKMKEIVVLFFLLVKMVFELCGY